MRRVQLLVTCLVVVLIGSGSRLAYAQTGTSVPSIATRDRLTAVAGDRVLDTRTARAIVTLRARPDGSMFTARRHWPWLFPNTAVPPFASDPLQRRHWWLDPLLRRHWWD